MRILRATVLIGVLTLPACNTMSDAEKTRLAEQSSTPVTCLPGAECDAKWRRSRDWVTDNSHFPILRANDREIITDASSGTLYPVITVRKVQNAQDESEESIVFIAECQNMIGCVPTEEQVTKSYRDYVENAPEEPEIDNDIELGATFGQATKSGGVPILAVTLGSAAAASGWRAGDRLVKFNGKLVSSGPQVDGLVAGTQPGSVFPVQILRDGRTIVTYMRV